MSDVPTLSLLLFTALRCHKFTWAEELLAQHSLTTYWDAYQKAFSSSFYASLSTHPIQDALRRASFPEVAWWAAHWPQENARMDVVQWRNGTSYCLSKNFWWEGWLESWKQSNLTAEDVRTRAAILQTLTEHGRIPAESTVFQNWAVLFDSDLFLNTTFPVTSLLEVLKNHGVNKSVREEDETLPDGVVSTIKQWRSSASAWRDRHEEVDSEVIAMGIRYSFHEDIPAWHPFHPNPPILRILLPYLEWCGVLNSHSWGHVLAMAGESWRSHPLFQSFPATIVHHQLTEVANEKPVSPALPFRRL